MSTTPRASTPKTKEKPTAGILPQQSGGAAAARAQLHADFKRREREAEGELRFQLYQQAMQLIAGGASQVQAARTLGIGQATLDRWRRRVARGESLATRTIIGRPSLGARFAPVLTNAHRQEIARLIVSGGSVPQAWRRFSRQPKCPAALRKFLRGRKSPPPSLLALIPLSRRKATVIECGNLTSITKREA